MDRGSVCRSTSEVALFICSMRWVKEIFVTWWPCSHGSANTSFVDTNTRLHVCSNLVCRCRRSFSAASGTSPPASHEWFWPGCTGRQEESLQRRNHLHVQPNRVCLHGSITTWIWAMECTMLTSLKHNSVVVLWEVFLSRLNDLREVEHCDGSGRIRPRHLTGQSTSATWELLSVKAQRETFINIFKKFKSPRSPLTFP